MYHLHALLPVGMAVMYLRMYISLINNLLSLHLLMHAHIHVHVHIHVDVHVHVIAYNVPAQTFIHTPHVSDIISTLFNKQSWKYFFSPVLAKTKS